MEQVFADLHIHIGRTFRNRPVKISASPALKISTIMETAFLKKGIKMIGVIDCHVPEVIEEIDVMIEQKMLFEHVDGGLISGDGCLILGTEIEVYDENCNGPIHVLIYLPYLNSMKHFSEWLGRRMTNHHLSSQRYYGSATELQRKTKELNGLFVIAHAFTPFKSLYGKGVHFSLKEVFYPGQIDAIELGLSANTEMADHIEELGDYSYLSNSDAHSLEKIGREYQLLEIEELSFSELHLAVKHERNRSILKNFGLPPQLGKYYRTCCATCGTKLETENTCPSCKRGRVVKGVSDRIKELSRRKIATSSTKRPPYISHVPLEFIPGIGPSRLNILRKKWGNDMNVIHSVSNEELLKVLPDQIVETILNARDGIVDTEEGGGGRYGRLI